MVKKEIQIQFLTDSSETGRHVVISKRTGRKYFIEPIGDRRMADWGSYNPSTGNIENKKGAGKFTGSVTEKESLIKEENGFKVHTVERGSPYDKIAELDSQYPDL